MAEASAPSATEALDPIALEVIWSRLIAVVNEQAAALVRTSFTPSVAEAGDLSACVFDARGHLLAHAVTGTPGHINSMEMCMKHLVRIFPPATLQPGDVLITNDPWIASGHLHDLSIVTPAFHADGRVVGFFGNVCHVADIGGLPFSADGRSRYEEGLFIPPLKLYKAGRPNEEVFAFVRANVRSPDEVVSELQSMTAANDVGVARLLESMAEFGLTSLEAVASAIIGRTEAATRAAIRALPDGVYRNQVTCDGYDAPITLAVTITIDGDGMRVDYAGTSPESPRGINVVLNYTRAYTTYALTCLLTPEIPNNEGAFRPVQVVAPAGCILNCRPPAPVSARHVLGHFLPGLIFGALAPVVPERMMAEGSANLWNVQLHGYWRDGTPFNLLWFNAGGTGARPALDGLSSTAFPSGVSGTAVEIIEQRAPVVVRRRQLRVDSGGPGRQRGGLGHWLVLQGAPRTDRPYTLSPFFDRTAHPARGLAGGRPGAPGRFCLRYPDGREETPLPKQTVTIDPAAEVWIGLPGGGGYGDPLTRDPALVLADVRAGLVSPAAALADYGVAVARDPACPDGDPAGWVIAGLRRGGDAPPNSLRGYA
jgi:N-methylhydantoinase B